MATNGNGNDGPPPNRGGDLQVLELRTMEELCQPTLNGRGGPISPIAMQEKNFGLKNDMINQVQNSCQFRGLPGDDANKHLDKFLHVTQSIKVNRVTNDALRLYLFPHSLTHHATACQIDTFYNGLTLRHRDTINAAAGGTFMKRRPEECYDLIGNMITHHNDWDTSVQMIVQVETQIPNSEPVVAPVVEPVEALIFQYLNFNISFADDLIIMPKFTSTIKSLLTNKDKLFELARIPLNEHCSAVLLEKLPEKLGDPEPIVSISSHTLTPFRDSDFLLEETDAFLATDDEPISPKIDDSYYDSKGDILLFEEFLNDDPSSPPLPPQEF
nr:reverse transcriptase domain-containing protein [Tanacetum cinerariifolium]